MGKPPEELPAVASPLLPVPMLAMEPLEEELSPQVSPFLLPPQASGSEDLQEEASATPAMASAAASTTSPPATMVQAMDRMQNTLALLANAMNILSADMAEIRAHFAAQQM